MEIANPAMFNVCLKRNYQHGLDIAQPWCALSVPNVALTKTRIRQWPSKIGHLEDLTDSESVKSDLV